MCVCVCECLSVRERVCVRACMRARVCVCELDCPMLQTFKSIVLFKYIMLCFISNSVSVEEVYSRNVLS